MSSSGISGSDPFYHNIAGDLAARQKPADDSKKLPPKTSEINKVCVLLLRHGIQTTSDLADHVDALAFDYVTIMDPNQKVTKEGLTTLFKEAVYAYGKVSAQFDTSVKMGSSEKRVLEHSQLLAESVLYGLMTGIGTVARPRAPPEKMAVDGEVKRFEEAYDRLKASEANIEKLSTALRDRLLSKEVIVVDNLVLGGGDAATEYWLDLQKGSHQKTDALLKKDASAVPGTIMLAKDLGNWKHDYTLAQTYSLLERGNAPANPQDYASGSKYEENRHVNARFLYQSNVVNLSETEAPIVLGTKVLEVQKKDQHLTDWKESSAPCRVKVQMETKATERYIDLTLSDRALANLMDALDVSGSNREEFKEALLGLLNKDMPNGSKGTLASSNMIGLTMSESRFKDAQKRLSLDPKITQTEFSKAVQKFIRDIVSDTVAKEQKNVPSFTKDVDTPYNLFIPKTSQDGLPVIMDGMLYVKVEERVNKYLYTRELNVCAGFGEAREISSTPWERKDQATGGIVSVTPEQIRKEDKDILCHFDPNLGYTPVIDGNTFMLTGREETGVQRDIIIYGGGGNATACYRKSFFGEDNNAESRVYSSENQRPGNIMWFAKEGFELAGYGRLAKQALSFAKANDQLCTGDLVRVEQAQDGSGKVIVYMKDTHGTYEGEDVKYSKAKGTAHPVTTLDIPVKLSDGSTRIEKVAVRKFECDQFIYTIGQEGRPVRSLFSEFDMDKETEVYSDPVSKMPLGVKTKDEALKFWGAMAMVVSPSFKVNSTMRQSSLKQVQQEAAQAKNEADKAISAAVTAEEKALAEMQVLKASLLRHKVNEYEARLKVSLDKETRQMDEWAGVFSENLRDWIVVQRIARDAEWPGVMPPSRASSRQAEFVKTTGLKLKDHKEMLGEALNAEQTISILVDELKAESKVLKRMLASNPSDQIRARLAMNAKKLSEARTKQSLAAESVAKIQAKLIESERQFDYVNANLDDIEYINGFLLNAGVEDLPTRLQFIGALLSKREEAYRNEVFPGVDKQTITDLIQQFHLENHIEPRGNSSIGAKKKTPDS